MILGQWGTLGVFGAKTPALTAFTVYNDRNITYRITGNDLFRAPAKVGGVDVFSITLTDWLNGESIDNAIVTAPDLTLNGSLVDNTQDAIGVSITGLSKGRYPVHFSWSTASGRGDCMTGYIDVREC
jgi:hypothetical protein